jgi:hypothetical protein
MILQRIELLSNQIDELDTYLKNVTVEDPKFKILKVAGFVWTA